MSGGDTMELLALCDIILEDGKHTYDEVNKLAEWLNIHSEACFQWPGNLLVAPLQKAWADARSLRLKPGKWPKRTIPAVGEKSD